MFNCVSDEFITYQGLCGAVHDALKTASEGRKYLYYEPKEFDHCDGAGVMEFPFRRDTFIVSSNKAKVVLGWRPQHSLLPGIRAEVAAYLAGDGPAEQWTVEELRYDLELLASKDLNFMFTYPFLDNPAINFEERPYPFESAAINPPAPAATA